MIFVSAFALALGALLVVLSADWFHAGRPRRGFAQMGVGLLCIGGAVWLVHP